MINDLDDQVSEEEHDGMGKDKAVEKDKAKKNDKEEDKNNNKDIDLAMYRVFF